MGQVKDPGDQQFSGTTMFGLHGVTGATDSPWPIRCCACAPLGNARLVRVTGMRVNLGPDHAGCEFKQPLIDHLLKNGPERSRLSHA